MRTLVASFTGLVIAASAAALGPPASARPESRPAAANQASGLTVRSSDYGRVLFDGRGKALYAFTRDPRGGKSRCYGACAAAWPVYYARGKLRAGTGVRQALVGTTVRRDGGRQVTYNGRPLYYYVADRSAGEIRCQNVREFGGTWLVVRPSGRLVR